MNDLHQARQVLFELAEKYGKAEIKNEAQTRFHIIDRVLEDCFNWRDDIEVEKHESKNGFTDYELGKPRILVVEAKREGITLLLHLISSFHSNPQLKRSF
ncbi:hypothetical protein ACIL2N_001496 [Vibrio metschnikovii]